MSRTDKETPVREPSVYVQSTMDSLLEKKSQVLRTKARIRCWLHGSTLYEQKDQDIKFHDMRQAQTVRKVTNDPIGTQFEIVIKKKTHTYICSSSQECTDWVSALQKCMMLKDSSDLDSNSMFYTEGDDYSVYSTIDGPAACNSSLPSPSFEPNNVFADKDYSTPYDMVEEPITNHNEYEEVKLRKSSYDSGSQNTQNSHSKEETVNNIYSDDNSDSVDPTDPYSKVEKKTNETDDPGDDLADLETAFADDGLTFDDLPHSLSSEDLSHVKTLKAFLHSNDMYQRSSSLQSSKPEDCLSALKACLSTLIID